MYKVKQKTVQMHNHSTDKIFVSHSAMTATFTYWSKRGEKCKQLQQIKPTFQANATMILLYGEVKENKCHDSNSYLACSSIHFIISVIVRKKLSLRVRNGTIFEDTTQHRHPLNGIFFQDNLGKQAPEWLNKSGL